MNKRPCRQQQQGQQEQKRALNSALKRVLKKACSSRVIQVDTSSFASPAVLLPVEESLVVVLSSHRIAPSRLVTRCFLDTSTVQLFMTTPAGLSKKRTNERTIAAPVVKPHRFSRSVELASFRRSSAFTVRGGSRLFPERTTRCARVPIGSKIQSAETGVLLSKENSSEERTSDRMEGPNREREGRIRSPPKSRYRVCDCATTGLKHGAFSRRGVLVPRPRK